MFPLSACRGKAGQLPFTPANLSGLVMWNETIPGKVWTTAAGSTPAVSGGPVGRVDPMYAGLPSLTQATALLRPSLALDAAGRLEARSDGASTYFDISSTVSISATFTVYARCTRTTGAEVAVLGHNPAGVEFTFIGFYSDGNTYIIDNVTEVAQRSADPTGNILARWVCNAGNATVAATGLANGAMTGAVPGVLDLNCVLARPGMDYTAVNNGVSAWVVYNRVLTAPEKVLVENYLMGATL